MSEGELALVKVKTARVGQIHRRWDIDAWLISHADCEALYGRVHNELHRWVKDELGCIVGERCFTSDECQ
jgi:hypothetical protein